MAGKEAAEGLSIGFLQGFLQNSSLGFAKSLPSDLCEKSEGLSIFPRGRIFPSRRGAFLLGGLPHHVRAALAAPRGTLRSP